MPNIANTLVELNPFIKAHLNSSNLVMVWWGNNRHLATVTQQNKLLVDPLNIIMAAPQPCLQGLITIRVHRFHLVFHGNAVFVWRELNFHLLSQLLPLPIFRGQFNFKKIKIKLEIDDKLLISYDRQQLIKQNYIIKES